ncbi:sensor histidine kinase [Halalkalibacter akibai]|uniref:histidine kinase n=1 Tax=Halalkalibacter akibai (strain ATCC 43226 / DSM 21942 / CIP 109018 / JCM 9157 / 1139) TaxID=1236973 RepID=W4QY13_HALA3|nr:HAMP domain-containing sensor histidine kinase [Halalkalibacter akibai]GAE37010.1 two-component sensor histidine kinase [Halalkalibacter akibai JCM 9157]
MIAEKLLLHVLIVLMPILVVSFFLTDRKEKQLKRSLVTLLTVAAVFCMVFAFEEKGLHWDLRYVLIVLAFFYGGLKAGWILCGVVLLTRALIDFDSFFIGFVMILITALLSHFFYHSYQHKVQKWDRVRFSIRLVLWPGIIIVVSMGIYLKIIGDLQTTVGHYATYGLVFTSTLVIAMGFATLLLEQLLERERLQEEMRRAVKMNAISELAASIAHEVRNPLTVVKGFLQLLERDEKGKKKEYFSIALTEMQRAEEIINDYLNFAKPQYGSSSIRAVEVNQVVKEIISILTPYALKENVELTTEASRDMFVHADRNQLKQVLINLIKNAIEATPKKGKVKLHIEEDCTLVKITITDTGKGMSAEQLANVGTLFYSTKETGTGLGTKVSFRIIEEMGGTLRFESKLHAGTKVTIIMPQVFNNEEVGELIEKRTGTQ